MSPTYLIILAKFFGEGIFDEMTEVIEPLLFDSDKHKQRAGAEILVGILRGEFQLRAIQKPVHNF